MDSSRTCAFSRPAMLPARQRGEKFDLHAAVVMPDHVHLIFTPLVDTKKMEVCSLAEIMDAIKGASAHKINKFLGRKGRVWQAESFDHVLRSSENVDAKVAYLLENPVRQGLAYSVGRLSLALEEAFCEPLRLGPLTRIMTAAKAELRSAGQPGAAVPT